ncbi:unnamed protein product [Adineta ricciae]|uniref:Uncharacterized protein n=1 Tax=Adineta ricciae TaxID=249248 RepID=A0A815FBJ3_ADIRI|nr:unnamed protein product [Adineta ricciae]CAF1322851.1 unnamed protein product [Adineta ricciae]
MDAIHIIMATSTSANPHNSPHLRIESLARKRKLSAVTFLVFGILLIVAGSLLASFEKQRFSVSFIVFGGIGIIFALMYWISAEKILIALRKLNAERMRQARYYAQNSGAANLVTMDSREFSRYSNSLHVGLPSYEQSVLHFIDIPPPYDEAIKIKSSNHLLNNSSQYFSPTPIHSISLAVDQAEAAATILPTTITSEQIPNR